MARGAREALAAGGRPQPLPPGIVREPSHCPHCKHPLAARDNIPLLGWLLLRGRCRYCKATISVQYPLVELLQRRAERGDRVEVRPRWPRAGRAGVHLGC